MHQYAVSALNSLFFGIFQALGRKLRIFFTTLARHMMPLLFGKSSHNYRKILPVGEEFKTLFRRRFLSFMFTAASHSGLVL